MEVRTGQSNGSNVQFFTCPVDDWSVLKNTFVNKCFWSKYEKNYAVNDTTKHTEDFIISKQALYVFPIQAAGTPSLTAMFPGMLHQLPNRSNNSQGTPH